VRTLRLLILLLAGVLLVGCQQPPLEGTWSLDGPGDDDTVITFFPDGTYSHDVADGKVYCRGNYRQAGGRLIMEQGSWFSADPDLQRRARQTPLEDTEVDIKWVSTTEAVLSAEGIAKILRRRA
jgi:hypothetical protein